MEENVYEREKVNGMEKKKEKLIIRTITKKDINKCNINSIIALSLLLPNILDFFILRSVKRKLINIHKRTAFISA